MKCVPNLSDSDEFENVKKTKSTSREREMDVLPLATLQKQLVLRIVQVEPRSNNHRTESTTGAGRFRCSNSHSHVTQDETKRQHKHWNRFPLFGLEREQRKNTNKEQRNQKHKGRDGYADNALPLIYIQSWACVFNGGMKATNRSSIQNQNPQLRHDSSQRTRSVGNKQSEWGSHASLSMPMPISVHVYQCQGRIAIPQKSEPKVIHC